MVKMQNRIAELEAPYRSSFGLQLHLDLSFANASFTPGAKEESGASFKYSSYSLAISSYWPLPVSACATIKCETANCLWLAREGTLRALVRARAVSPFCSSTLARAVRLRAFRPVGSSTQQIRLRFLVSQVLVIELTQIEIGLLQSRINLCGGAERLHGILAVLQLNFHQSKIVECFCVFRKRSNRLLKMIFGFLPALLVHFLRAQLELLLGSLWDDWRESWAGHLTASRLRQAHLYTFRDIRSPLAATRFNGLACRCLDVGPAHPHLITPAGNAVERSAAISVGCPYIRHAPERRNQLYPQSWRGPVGPVVRDTNGYGGHSGRRTRTHRGWLLCGTCRGEKGNRQSRQPNMTRSHDCPIYPGEGFGSR